jgi:glycine dehydrogenase subunit 2
MNREKTLLREEYHAHRWHEPIIMEMGTPGERGVIPPTVEDEIESAVGDPLSSIPEAVRRKSPLRLPELSQPQVLRHFLRLSQETLGTDVNIDLGLGTCTMKYSPKVNEFLARSRKITEIHPLQSEDTIQGLLEIMHKFSQMLCEISGMDAVSFQPGGGAAGIFTNARIIQAYHALNGEEEQRDEIITTVFSHPADAATPAAAGYKVITLYPDESGYPDLTALESVVGKSTAGLMMTNPEDTGIFNPRIREYTDAVHAVGGICAIDQANANGILGITRARELGFDLCQFNLHKTFSSPHGSEGPGCGAVAVGKEFAKYLPLPLVAFDGTRYYLDYNMPHSIGKIKGFLGNVGVVLRAYAWVMSLGAEGLKTAAQIAVLNNNYLAKRVSEIRGVSIPYAEGKYRLQEVRYSWKDLEEETGVTTDDVKRRMVDFGVNNYFTSHAPWIVPEPFTLEPTESYSKKDLDEYVQILERVSSEAYEDAEHVKSAPHRSSIAKMDESVLHDPEKVVTTWRAWEKREKSVTRDS